MRNSRVIRITVVAGLVVALGAVPAAITANHGAPTRQSTVATTRPAETGWPEGGEGAKSAGINGT
jgi:hypothetical protein